MFFHNSPEDAPTASHSKSTRKDVDNSDLVIEPSASVPAQYQADLGEDSGTAFPYTTLSPLSWSLDIRKSLVPQALEPCDEITTNNHKT